MMVENASDGGFLKTVFLVVWHIRRTSINRTLVPGASGASGWNHDEHCHR